MLKLKSTLTAVAVTGMAAAAVTATLSAAPASATNQVDCGDRTDFVKIWYHSEDGSQHYVSCFANAGWVDWGAWTDQISTGNNAISVHDADGDAFTIAPWTVYNPINSFDMADFTVL